MKTELQAVVLVRRLWVQNANAIASPMSYGFPALTAFTGAVHAVQRSLNAQSMPVTLDGVGVICHAAELQTNRDSGYVTRFNLRRDPVGQDGSSAALVEEGRVHLDLSLVIGITAGCPVSAFEQQEVARRIDDCLRSMRLAGGSVLPHPSPKQGRQQSARLFELPLTDKGRSAMFRNLTRLLLPGFALISRHELLRQHWRTLLEEQPDASSLDALLDLCALHWTPNQPPPPTERAASSNGQIPPVDARESLAEITTWNGARRKPGWLVPIPVGYNAVSELYAPGVVKRSRDLSAPFRFVESVLSLGEWKSPHRLASLDELLWHHHARPDQGLYLVKTAADMAASPL